MTEEDLEFEEFLRTYRKRLTRLKQYNQTHPAQRLYNSARARALRNKIEFTITQEDIVIPTHCPYLGVELTNIQLKGRQPSNLSLDRVDNTKGYVPGNIQVISDLANRMKQDATKEQLITFAKGVLNLFTRT